MPVPRRTIWPQIGPGQQRCPDCNELVEAEQINIREGVALCPACGSLSRLADLIWDSRAAQEILRNPPGGCTVEQYGNGAVVSASLRNLTTALVSSVGSLFWNSIVSVFVLIALAGLWFNLLGPLPAWLPAPGVKAGVPVMNDEPMAWGETLFLCFFLTPFVAIGAGLAGSVILSLIGSTELKIDESGSSVSTGIGFVRWSRRFDPREVKSVSYGSYDNDSVRGIGQAIELLTEKRIRLGRLLPWDRKEWLRIVLKELLLKPDGKRLDPKLPPLKWISRGSKSQ